MYNYTNNLLIGPMKDTLYTQTLKHKSFNGVTVAIIPAKYWYKDFFEKNMMPYFIQEEDFVVCSWHDYYDGEKSNIEGKMTIAVCKRKKDADKVFEMNIL